SVFSGFYENKRDGMLAAQVLEQRRQLFKLHAFASVDKQSRTRESTFPSGVKLRENRHQLDRKIVDAIVTHVLECFKDRAFAGAGQSGKDDELPGFGCRRLRDARAAQLFTLRWCVLGMRISSRYLATVRRVT